jgi:hypothetical protein
VGSRRFKVRTGGRYNHEDTVKCTVAKAREAELRAYLLDGGDRRGDEWRATISVQERERLDLAAIKQAFAPEALEPFWITSTYSVVKLNRIIGRTAFGFPALV